MPPFDVAGVGLNATDTLILLPHFPPYGGKVPFEREVFSPGGQVASAMVTCARLGLRAKYIGTLGDDERGAMQLESLRVERHQSGRHRDPQELPEPDRLYSGGPDHRRAHRALASRRMPAHRRR